LKPPVFSSSSTKVNQAGASAQGDIVAGNKDESHVHHHYASTGSGVVQTLLEKLQTEITENPKACDIIERLQRFHKGEAADGIVGLEAKLAAGGRSSEYLDALERKEMFVKLLERWSLYATAQMIFAYLLARAEYEFKFMIHPQIADCTQVQVNQLTRNLIVEPTVADCGSSFFEVDHNVAIGMVYWLADKCFVRWHK
jgi:hypothetical protein